MTRTRQAQKQKQKQKQKKKQKRRRKQEQAARRRTAKASRVPPSHTGRSPPLADNPLVDYALALRKWSRDSATRNPMAFLDRVESNLDLSNYMAVIQEARTDIELLLLAKELPHVFRACADAVEDADRMMDLYREVAQHSGFDHYQQCDLDLSAPDLAPALQHDDYSFTLPPSRVFPLLCRQVDDREDLYAPQYVADNHVFSPALRALVPLPIVHHRRELEELWRNTSFIHEGIHVMQRVLRKQRVPCYVYNGDGRKEVRNPVQYVRIGVEKEIEVQQILVRAGYEFRLPSILHHKENLVRAFADTPSEERLALVREGLESISFHKYADLGNENLRQTLFAHFLEDWP